MALPTEEEQKAIGLFRERVKDILSESQLNDDFFLLRWLRARELDLSKAEQMLRTAQEWRKVNNVDESLTKKIDPFFSENYPRWIGGSDKEGRPLYCAALHWDLRLVVRKGDSKGFQEYLTNGYEQLMNLLKEANEARTRDGENDPKSPPITQIVSIFDFAGFPWTQLLNYKAVGELLTFGSIYEAYYPEILHTCYFINSPSLISKVFFLLKPVIAPKTMDKIKCFGTNREEWQAELLKVIDEDQLIPQFGGVKDASSF